MRSLIDHYATRWQNIPEFKALQDALDYWAEKLQVDWEDFLSQLNVETATWGLACWEEMLGITPDSGSDYTTRRETITGKLRRTGTTTKAAVKNIAEGFIDGTATVVQYTPLYAFKVILEVARYPKNIKEITAALEEVKPAHLVLQMLIRILREDDISLYAGVIMRTTKNREKETGQWYADTLTLLVEDEGTVSEEDIIIPEGLLLFTMQDQGVIAGTPEDIAAVTVTDGVIEIEEEGDD